MIRNANGASNRDASFKKKPAQMPSCIWPASTRPLFIKSVWMDGWDRQGGYRHFILNTTDWTTTTTNASNDEEQTYKNISKPQQHHRTPPPPPPRQLEPLDPRNFQADQSPPENVTRKEKLRRQQSYQNPTQSQRKLSCKELPKSSTQGNKDRVSFLRSQLKERLIRDFKGNPAASGEGIGDIEFYIDPVEKLTERVLQWLDLAGKAPLSIGAEENCGGSGQKEKNSKRVFTAHPALGGSSASAFVNGKRLNPPLKRSESIHRLSLTFNEEESPPTILHLSQLSGRKLRKMSSTKAKTAPNATGGQIYSGPGKLNIMSPKSTSSSNSSGTAGGSASGGVGTVTQSQSKPAAAAQRGGGGKKKTLGKLGKTESIENQYKSMIHRQLLETSCNTQLAKRQLHIFMPNPKLGTAQSNECDSSCLNSLISEGSKN